MTNALPAPEFLSVLRAAVRDAGGVRAFARRHQISEATVCLNINGKMPLRDCVVNAAGYLRVETFIPARRQA